MKKTKQSKETTTTGFVTATDWDDEGNVIELSISADDDDYIVEPNKMWKELLNFLDEEIELTGLVKKDKNGTKRIAISSYEVLESDYEYGNHEDYVYDDEEKED